MRLSVDPDLLDGVARNLDNIAGDLNKQRRAFKAVASDVEAAWQSDLTGIYTEHVGTVEKKTGKTAGSLSDAARELRRIAAEVRELERQLEEQMARERAEAEAAKGSGGGGGGSW